VPTAPPEQSWPHQEKRLDQDVMTMTIKTTAEALFVSSLQPSDRLSAARVAGAVHDSVRTHPGARGCAAALATEYGEHPETAADRMRWALKVAADYAPALARSA
jgi:hypothetical protein